MKPQVVEKGQSGEHKVSLVLHRLNRQYYKVLNNVLIRNERTGKTAQIDHIVVSVFGVYVIETKNYEGMILGDEFDHSWVQVTDSTTQELYNPMRQNYGHVKALKSLLWEGVSITSIVCFLDGAELTVNYEACTLIKESSLEELFWGQREMVMMFGQMDDIVNTIKSNMLSGELVEREHGRSVWSAKEYARLKLANVSCPKCRRPAVASMIGEAPRFCSDFPKCNHVRSLEGA
jgi:hypothetical protein